VINRMDNSLGPRRLYRDKENAVLLGVCAGIADYFGFKVVATRVLTVLAGFFAVPLIFFVYLGAGFLLPAKPQGMFRNEEEEDFWRSVRRDPRSTLHEVRHTFRNLDAKLQRMERYVTSSRFDLDKEFRDLGK